MTTHVPPDGNRMRRLSSCLRVDTDDASLLQKPKLMLVRNFAAGKIITHAPETKESKTL